MQRLASTLAPLTFLLLLGLILSRIAPNFATRDNLKQIAVQSAVIAILACGQTAVIISGNIDLSVGAMMAFSGVVVATAMTQHGVGMWPAVLLACVSGLLVGAVTGLITAFGKIPSFIVTLGMMGVVYGAGGVLAGSKNIGGLPAGFAVFGSKELFGSADRDGIPYAILIMVAVALVVGALLARTRWGRTLYAMGGNREATRLSGISLNRATISVFALSGLLAGIAAVVNTSRTGIAAYDAGNSYELYAVAATVIGGTSLFGGQGGIPGTIIGALLMFTIRNGCALSNVSPNFERAIIGAVVILAVLYDRFGPGRNRARS
jgi:ribose transport system permease protein